MITLQTRQYKLPRAMAIQFFRSAEHFALKVRKHFLCPQEPWHRLFGADFLKSAGKNWSAQSVTVVAEAYAKAVDILDGAIRFAEHLPLYVRARQEFEFRRRGYPSQQRVFYFLDRSGFKTVAFRGVLRTAYFCCKTANDSAYTLFREAWASLRARALSKQYVSDHPRGLVHNHHVDLFSQENWKTCPNPHPSDRPPRPSRALPEDVALWLDEVGRLE